MKRKLVLPVIIWVSSILLCIFGVKISKGPGEIISKSKAVTGSVVEVINSRVSEEDNGGQGDNKVKSHTYKLYQDLRVTYNYSGKDYSAVLGGVMVYHENDIVALSNSAIEEMIYSRGYKNGSSIEVYVDKDNPNAAYYKKNIDGQAESGQVYMFFVAAFIMDVLGVALLFAKDKR